MKTKYVEVGRYWYMMVNEYFRISSNSYEKVKTFKHLGSLLKSQNSIQEEIKRRLEPGNSCYYSVQTLLLSRLLSKNLKIKICNRSLPIMLYGYSMVSYIKGEM